MQSKWTAQNTPFTTVFFLGSLALQNLEARIALPVTFVYSSKPTKGEACSIATTKLHTAYRSIEACLEAALQATQRAYGTRQRCLQFKLIKTKNESQNVHVFMF